MLASLRWSRPPKSSNNSRKIPWVASFFRLEERQIVSDHYSPSGHLLQTFKVESTRDLSNLITPFVGHIEHGAYVGKEINRLAFALSDGEIYKQDKVK
jgi:hypothetical protein